MNCLCELISWCKFNKNLNLKMWCVILIILYKLVGITGIEKCRNYCIIHCNVMCNCVAHVTVTGSFNMWVICGSVNFCYVFSQINSTFILSPFLFPGIIKGRARGMPSYKRSYGLQALLIPLSLFKCTVFENVLKVICVIFI